MIILLVYEEGIIFMNPFVGVDLKNCFVLASLFTHLW